MSLIVNIQFFLFQVQPLRQGLMSVYNFHGFTLDQSIAILSINSSQVNFRFPVKHFFHVKRHIKQHSNILITEVSNSLTLSQKLLLANNVSNIILKFQVFPLRKRGTGQNLFHCVSIVICNTIIFKGSNWKGTAVLSGLNEIETTLQ